MDWNSHPSGGPVECEHCNAKRHLINTQARCVCAAGAHAHTQKKHRV